MSAPAAESGRALGVPVRYRDAGSAVRDVDLVDAATIRFEDLPAYRKLVSYKGQRSFTGLWWFATTGVHVPYGSWVQRDQVMVLDRRPEVVALRSQPFAVSLTLTTGATWHVPDYLGCW